MIHGLWKLNAMCILAPTPCHPSATRNFISGYRFCAALLRRAVEIDPTNKDARLALANILLRGDRYNQTSVDQAIVHLEAGLQADPELCDDPHEIWLGALFRAGRFDEASEVWLSYFTR